jgi:type IV pilus assembly protein PilA
MRFKRNPKGFSLIELLIVVAIILIIAAIAIPNLLRSKIAANQASAVGSLRTLVTSEITYSSTYSVGFTANLGELGPPSSGGTASVTNADLIDETLAGGSLGSAATSSSKSGYEFVYAGGSTDTAGQYESFTVTASPVVVNQTGQNYYFTDASGVIRFNTSTTASASDSPIGG